jgi:hypothetical protein
MYVTSGINRRGGESINILGNGYFFSRIRGGSPMSSDAETESSDFHPWRLRASVVQMHES